jgi:hypothetical protein
VDPCCCWTRSINTTMSGDSFNEKEKENTSHTGTGTVRVVHPIGIMCVLDPILVVCMHDWNNVRFRS